MFPFQFAAGSIIGKDHVLIGKNNQDGFYALSDQKDITVAVVCDGCSSGQHSEVGAKIGASLTAFAVRREARRALSRASPKGENPFITEQFWKKVQQDVLSHILLLAQAMGDSLSDTIWDYFLFTTVGVLITKEWSTFFHLGDGVIIVNGYEYIIPQYPDNEPPYIGYGLVESSINPELIRYVSHGLPTPDVTSFLIGTDGVEELIRSAEKTVPGRTEIVGPISQFWENPSYFASKDAVRRRLAILNREGRRINYQAGTTTSYHGLLSDDTTIIIGRRKEAERTDG